MLTEKLFNIAQNGAEFILLILLLTSVLSIALIFERFFTLRGVKNRSNRAKSRMREALQANSGNQTRTAVELGLSRRGLIDKLQRYNIRQCSQVRSY